MPKPTRSAIVFAALLIATIGICNLIHIGSFPVVLAFADDPTAIPSIPTHTAIEYLDLLIRIAALIIAWYHRQTGNR